MALKDELMKAIADLNFVVPTEIQQKSIPWLLEHKHDLIALSQTGSGKTAAFGLPVIQGTDLKSNSIQTLILCPTRELCLQITNDFKSYSKYINKFDICAVYGGASVQNQIDQLKNDVNVVVGTPGRVFDLLRRKILKVDAIERLILDEADEMLNMGFQEELFGIMKFTPKEKQTILFSATMPKDVIRMAREFMHDPHKISAGHENKGAENIKHYYYKVHARDKYYTLKRIADMNPKIYGIVFCRTRKETQEIAEKLQSDNYNVDSLHGDLSQNQRERVMNGFRKGHIQLLIATDVAARGIDVDDLTHIINYHPPEYPDVYIHRSGRTGRAGKSGTSITIINYREEKRMKQIEDKLGKPIVRQAVPSGKEVCEKQLFNFVDKVENVVVEETQMEGFIDRVYKRLEWLNREDLIKRFVAVEFNQYLEYYKDAADLNYPEEKKRKKKNKDEDVDFTRFFINMGSSDNLTKKALMYLVNRMKFKRSIDIGKIEILSNFSFIELDSRYESKILKQFGKMQYNGIQLRIEVAEEKKKVRNSDKDNDNRSGNKTDYRRKGKKKY